MPACSPALSFTWDTRERNSPFLRTGEEGSRLFLSTWDELFSWFKKRPAFLRWTRDGMCSPGPSTNTDCTPVTL